MSVLVSWRATFTASRWNRVRQAGRSLVKNDRNTARVAALPMNGAPEALVGQYNYPRYHRILETRRPRKSQRTRREFPLRWNAEGEDPIHRRHKRRSRTPKEPIESPSVSWLSVLKCAPISLVATAFVVYCHPSPHSTSQWRPLGTFCPSHQPIRGALPSARRRWPLVLPSCYATLGVRRPTNFAGAHRHRYIGHRYQYQA